MRANEIMEINHLRTITLEQLILKVLSCETIKDSSNLKLYYYKSFFKHYSDLTLEVNSIIIR